MTTAAEFFGDPEVMDELVVRHGADVVAAIVPTVMGILVVREAGSATGTDKQRMFRDDLRYATTALFLGLGDPARLEKFLDRTMEDGIDSSQRMFPAVTAFLEGRFDQFLQEICASFDLPLPPGYPPDSRE